MNEVEFGTRRWHAMEKSAVLAALEAQADGLSEGEAARRLDQGKGLAGIAGQCRRNAKANNYFYCFSNIYGNVLRRILGMPFATVLIERHRAP